jgi:HlyD family secretion protein
MGGTVTLLELAVGERASAGQAAVVLSDLTTFVVEVNLDETDVAKVSVGQGAIMTLDAFPDEELAGKVTDIAPVANIQSGVVLYPVTVQLAPAEVPARVGMTANVEIITASKADVLIVPLRAIQSEGGKSYIWRQSADGFEKVEVTLGVMTEVEVEITGGLTAGDVVSVVASPDQGGGQPGWGPGGMFGGGGDE